MAVLLHCHHGQPCHVDVAASIAVVPVPLWRHVGQEHSRGGGVTAGVTAVRSTVAVSLRCHRGHDCSSDCTTVKTAVQAASLLCHQ